MARSPSGTGEFAVFRFIRARGYMPASFLAADRCGGKRFLERSTLQGRQILRHLHRPSHEAVLVSGRG